MHLRVCISGGPLCDPHTSGRSASTGHGGRINRQKADERDGEIDIDGVVERDAECVGNVDEFGPADGQQSGRNLNTHIPMPAFARLDTGPPPFAGDSACAMGRKVALDGFLGHFFPLRLYRLVGVRRRGGGKGADVLEECETEVFDLSETAVAYAHVAPQALAADPGGSAHRDAQADGAPVAGETPAEALLGGGLEGGGAGREGAGGVEAGEEDDGAVEVGDRAFAGGGREQLEGRHEHIAHARAATVRGGERALCARRGGEGEAERDAVCPRGGKPEAVGVGRGGEQGGGRVERARLVVEHVPRRRQLCERSDRDTPPAITHLQTPPHAPCRRPPAGPRSPAPRPHAPPPAPAPPPPSTTHSRSATTSTVTRARPFLLASSRTFSPPTSLGAGSSLSRDSRLDRAPPRRIPSSCDDRCVPDAGCSSVPCRTSSSAPSDSDRPRCFGAFGRGAFRGACWCGCRCETGKWSSVLSLHGRECNSSSVYRPFGLDRNSTSLYR